MEAMGALVIRKLFENYKIWKNWATMAEINSDEIQCNLRLFVWTQCREFSEFVFEFKFNGSLLEQTIVEKTKNVKRETNPGYQTQTRV
jgi:hypothetical protein